MKCVRWYKKLNQKCDADADVDADTDADARVSRKALLLYIYSQAKN